MRGWKKKRSKQVFNNKVISLVCRRLLWQQAHNKQRITFYLCHANIDGRRPLPVGALRSSFSSASLVLGPKNRFLAMLSLYYIPAAAHSVVH
jgi:hypothetical protein